MRCKAKQRRRVACPVARETSGPVSGIGRMRVAWMGRHAAGEKFPL